MKFEYGKPTGVPLSIPPPAQGKEDSESFSWIRRNVVDRSPAVLPSKASQQPPSRGWKPATPVSTPAPAPVPVCTTLAIRQGPTKYTRVELLVEFPKEKPAAPLTVAIWYPKEVWIYRKVFECLYFEYCGGSIATVLTCEVYQKYFLVACQKRADGSYLVILRPKPPGYEEEQRQLWLKIWRKKHQTGFGECMVQLKRYANEMRCFRRVMKILCDIGHLSPEQFQFLVGVLLGDKVPTFATKKLKLASEYRVSAVVFAACMWIIRAAEVLSPNNSLEFLLDAVKRHLPKLAKTQTPKFVHAALISHVNKELFKSGLGRIKQFSEWKSKKHASHGVYNKFVISMYGGFARRGEDPFTHLGETPSQKVASALNQIYLNAKDANSVSK